MVPLEFVYSGKPVRLAFASETDHLAKVVRRSGTFYETDLLEALRPLLKPGDLVVDVGANVGNHAVFFGLITGAEVVCYEPIDAAAQCLSANAAMNDLDEKISIRRAAVGARKGLAEVKQFNASNLGATQLAMASTGSLPVVTLDEERFSKPVRLIKIDAEGMDLLVLQGARQRIRSDRPILVCEAHTSGEFDAINSELGSLQYQPIGVFCATSTYLFLPVESEAERRLAAQTSWTETLRAHQSIRAMSHDIRKARAEIDNLKRSVEKLSAKHSSNTATPVAKALRKVVRAARHWARPRSAPSER